MADNYHNPHIPGDSLGPPRGTGFEVSDFFQWNDWIEENPGLPLIPEAAYNPTCTPNETVLNISANSSSFSEGAINRDTGTSRENTEIREKVAFKTKSEVEVLDDGFKWRKYGKKMVKNSPNPRNYYRCSVEGCPVKKRVERDKEDPRYVVTTYEGIHSHPGTQL